MPRLVEYRFKISNLAPETLPLGRLATYLDYLNDLIGVGDNIHLLKIEKSSAVPVLGILERESIKAERRLFAVRSGGGPISARRAFQDLDTALAEDSASGILVGPPGRILEFPGSKRPRPEPPLGPIKEEATIEGELVQMGGRDDSISVYLRKKDKHEQNCTATRAQGKDLARCMFSKVRVYGMGSWLRHSSGQWELQDIIIERFVPLKEESFSATIKRLHAVKSAAEECEDPTQFLESLRNEKVR
jgi:hypothetical protein